MRRINVACYAVTLTKLLTEPTASADDPPAFSAPSFYAADPAGAVATHSAAPYHPSLRHSYGAGLSSLLSNTAVPSLQPSAPTTPALPFPETPSKASAGSSTCASALSALESPTLPLENQQTSELLEEPTDLHQDREDVRPVSWTSGNFAESRSLRRSRSSLSEDQNATSQSPITAQTQDPPDRPAKKRRKDNPPLTDIDVDSSPTGEPVDRVLKLLERLAAIAEPATIARLLSTLVVQRSSWQLMSKALDQSGVDPFTTSIWDCGQTESAQKDSFSAHWLNWMRLASIASRSVQDRLFA